MRRAFLAAETRVVKKWLIRIAIGLVVLLVLIQAIPYGRNHKNPPVTKELAWDSAATRQLADGACFDCHSNLTRWRWYTNIAPISWLVYADVKGGRETLNFSEWDKPQDADPGDVVSVVRDGSMPPIQYKPLHKAARLSKQEREQLAQGLEKSLARDPPISGGGGG